MSGLFTTEEYKSIAKGLAIPTLSLLVARSNKKAKSPTR
jgi:hypothetical protein